MKKKMVSLMLCVCMAVAVAGCGGKKFNNPKKGDELIMATNAYFEPYEYYEGDAVVGIDAEIAQAIADRTGRQRDCRCRRFGRKESWRAAWYDGRYLCS